MKLSREQLEQFDRALRVFLGHVIPDRVQGPQPLIRRAASRGVCRGGSLHQVISPAQSKGRRILGGLFCCC